MTYTKGNSQYESLLQRWIVAGRPGTFVFHGTTYRELDNGEKFTSLSAYEDATGFEENYGQVSNRIPERRIPSTAPIVEQTATIENNMQDFGNGEAEPGDFIAPEHIVEYVDSVTFPDGHIELMPPVEPEQDGAN